MKQITCFICSVTSKSVSGHEPSECSKCKSDMLFIKDVE